MKPFLALLLLLSSLLFVSEISARKDVEEYWKRTMKDQKMPESIQKLLRNCHGAENDDEETGRPKPSGKDLKLGDIRSEGERSFAEDFDPGPDATVYDNGIGLKEGKGLSGKGFEMSPDTTIYVQGITPRDERFSAKEIENKGEKKSVSKEFEPGPDVTIYSN